jgi:hypothetical protein
VRVSDGRGGVTTSAPATLTVTNVAPTVTIAGGPAGAVAAGTAIGLTAAVTDPGVEAFAYAWSVTRDGAAFAGATTAAFAFTPTVAGTYVVTLTVGDGDGGSGAAAPRTFTVTVTAAPPAVPTLIAAGSAWKYLDNGSDQGAAWRAAGFNDSAWQSGAAQLGYGDGDEATVVASGPSSNKYITTYFRHHFAVADASAVTALALRLLRDDGAVVYLNGVEVFRSNMPTGTITHLTRAASTESSAASRAWHEAALSPALLSDGDNVLAVEVHQVNPTSGDISFDLELTATR